MNEEIQHFAMQLLAGDQKAAWMIIEQLHKQGHSCLAVYQFFTDAMRYVGELWETNIITVADEHLATGVCDVVLSQYAFLCQSEAEHAAENTQDKRKAMVLCLEGESHDLGAKMVAAMFERKHWNVRFLGSNTPLDHAVRMAEQFQPDVVGLSVAIVYHLPKLADYIRAFEALEHCPTVLVGGRLVGRYDFRKYGSGRTVLAKELASLEAWLEKESFTR